MHQQRKIDLNTSDYSKIPVHFQGLFFHAEKCLTCKNAEINGFVHDFGTESHSIFVKNVH